MERDVEAGGVLINDVREFSVPSAKLFCLVGNLFAELEPPCNELDAPEALTLCGKAPSGREAMLFVYQEYRLFVGNPEDLEAARNGRWDGELPMPL